MILLKIGSGNGCNIVMHSNYVSGLHAEMVLLDNGDIFIEDKGSTNGTFVGGQRLRPNVETKVTRGDLIKLGDSELLWQQVPVLKNKGYKAIYNIGSSLRNDIQLTSQFASRYHATLFIDQQGKATLVDNCSKNGTEVNGTRIPSERPVPLKKGYQVVCADEDITQQIKALLPGGNKALLYGGLGLLAAAVVAAGIIFLPKLFNGKNEPAQQPQVTVVDSTGTNAPTATAPNIEEIRKAVVYVDAQYTLVAKIEDCPINVELWKNTFGSRYSSGELPIPARMVKNGTRYSATAFFLDREGNLATNMHVATPWKMYYEEGYGYEDERVYYQTQIERLMDIREIGSKPQSDFAYNERSEGAMLWNIIKQQAAQSGNNSIQELNAIIRQIKRSKVSLSGKIDFISVGYPGRNYTHQDEYDRCYVRAAGDNVNNDIAILQLNNKKTPDDVTFVFSPDKFYTGTIEPNKDPLTWIGYPRGRNWNMENNTLEPQIRETKCAKIPTGDAFEFDSEVVGGASGSPIYNSQTGQLYGVVNSGKIAAATYSRAIQAKNLKKLYDDLP